MPAELAGNPSHPDHDRYLRQLGQATYDAARVAGITFDLLRIFHYETSDSLYEDPLGRLMKKLRDRQRLLPTLPDFDDFADVLNTARITRNDLLHALPVRDGLYRRTAGPGAYVRTFFTVEELIAASLDLDAAARYGSDLLHHDGGAAIRAWYDAGGS